MTGEDRVSAERNFKEAVPISSPTSAISQPAVKNPVESAPPKPTTPPLAVPAQPSAAKPQQPVLVTATQNSDVDLSVVEPQPRGC